jgi:hypothetical protein
MMMNSSFTRGLCIAAVSAGAFGAAAMADTVLYSDGFEGNSTTWVGTTPVASGTNGVVSSAGSYHGQTGTYSYTTFGGYNFGAGNVPSTFQEYRTSVDIYLDLGTASNGQRFDYTAAISEANDVANDGYHLRDFVFNGGFYDNGVDDRFLVRATNNAGAGQLNELSPGTVEITTTGWYTFQHHFYDNAGVLAVDMQILDSANGLVGSWTLSSPADLIALVGGSRYGWLSRDGATYFDNLLVDNSMLTTIPLPPAAWAGFSTLAGVGLVGFVRRRRQIA